MKNTGLLRRLGAILYDSLLVLALLFLGTLPFIAARGGDSVQPGTLAYQVSLVAIAYLFFVGFWHFHGRTLGMQSWGLQLERIDGGKAGFARCNLRFLCAIISWLTCGLGFLWQLVDRDRLAWHDRASGTCLRHYLKKDKAKKADPAADQEDTTKAH